jgi:hypothetical protein
MMQKKAFSLPELSIILIIISIIIIGVVNVKGDLLNKAKINNIIKLTKISPLIDLDNLSIWLEVGTKDSFKNSEVIDGSYLSLWKNIAPNYHHKINFSQTVAINQPKYIISNNSLPSLSFDGGDYLSAANIYGHQFTKENQATIFIVQKYNSPNHSSKIINWESTGTNKFTLKSTDSSGNIVWHFANDTISKISNSDFNDKWNIITLTKGSNNINIRINGSLLYSVGVSDDFDITVLSDFNIGTNFNGEIREIAIIKNKISSQEIDEIEKYLSRKWDIDLI